MKVMRVRRELKPKHLSFMDRFEKAVKQLFILEPAGKQKFLPGGPDELEKLYKKAHQEKRELRIKLGIDPTSTDLHLGHTVCLHMLRKFQEHGHKPVLIIGDFTATVGDPSGRNEARPPLTYEQAKTNAKTYLTQVGKILDINKVEVRYNSEWLSKLTLAKLLELSHLVTVNQLIAKEAFGARIECGDPLYLHEVLYPILQGYDSYSIKADVEIGGTDQTYNILFGRHIQKHFGQEPQLAILNPLLIGLDGTKKMSKTFNNYIALQDLPSEIFGKAMSIPDELIMSYFNVTDISFDEMKNVQEELNNGKNPRDIKMLLAFKLVKQLYNASEAEIAKEGFVKQFQKKEIPDNVNEYWLGKPKKIIDVMYEAKLVSSKSEAKRLIESGGVKLNTVKISDPNYEVTKEDQNTVLQIGKRKFVKIV